MTGAAQGLWMLCALAGADPLWTLEPGELEASGVGTAPERRLLDEEQERGRAQRSPETVPSLGALDVTEVAWSLAMGTPGAAELEAMSSVPSESPLEPGRMVEDVDAAWRASADGWEGFPTPLASEEVPGALASTPMPAVPSTRWAATGAAPLVSPVVPTDVAPAARILLASSAGTGAALGAAGAVSVLVGQYLLALVGTHSVDGRRAAFTGTAGSLMMVGGALMVVAALGAGALAVTAVLVGVAAEKLAPAPVEKP